jgi:hypothetical protein
MTELNASVKEFFDRYERANTEFNVERIAALYADVFMFGDPPPGFDEESTGFWSEIIKGGSVRVAFAAEGP